MAKRRPRAGAVTAAQRITGKLYGNTEKVFIPGMKKEMTCEELARMIAAEIRAGIWTGIRIN